jgi:hypothetical protein
MPFNIAAKRVLKSPHPMENNFIITNRWGWSLRSLPEIS